MSKRDVKKMAHLEYLDGELQAARVVIDEQRQQIADLRRLVTELRRRQEERRSLHVVSAERCLNCGVSPENAAVLRRQQQKQARK